MALSPAFSDDRELVLAYARRGRTWGAAHDRSAPTLQPLYPGGPGRWRPSIALCWPGGMRVVGLRVLIPGAD